MQLCSPIGSSNPLPLPKEGVPTRASPKGSQRSKRGLGNQKRGETAKPVVRNFPVGPGIQDLIRTLYAQLVRKRTAGSGTYQGSSTVVGNIPAGPGTQSS